MPETTTLAADVAAAEHFGLPVYGTGAYVQVTARRAGDDGRDKPLASITIDLGQDDDENAGFVVGYLTAGLAELIEEALKFDGTRVPCHVDGDLKKRLLALRDQLSAAF